MDINYVKNHESFGELFQASLRKLNRSGITRGNTKEIENYIGVLDNPEKVWNVPKERKQNIYAIAYEILWVLSGDTDIDTLTTYIPRAPSFSDDGVTWRAGYGERLKIPGSRKSQLDYILEELKRDPSSRRAVCNLWRPQEDSIIFGSKDYPCTQLLQFLIRDNTLHLKVNMRSNDIFWGFSHINVYEFTYIQRLVHYFLKKSDEKFSELKLGKYIHEATSFHYYPENIKFSIPSLMDPKNLEKYPEILNSQTNSNSSSGISNFTDLMDWLNHDLHYIHGGKEFSFKDKEKYPPFIQDLLSLCYQYQYPLKVYGLNDIKDLILYRRAQTCPFLNRKIKKLKGEIK